MSRKEWVERGDIGKRFLFSFSYLTRPEPFDGVVKEFSPSGDYFAIDSGAWYPVKRVRILEELPAVSDAAGQTRHA